MILPGSNDLTAYRNGIFRYDLQYLLNGAPVDMTGGALRMQVRDSEGGATAYIDINSAGAGVHGSIITFPAIALGKFQLYIANLDLITVPAATPVSGSYKGFYDVIYTEAGGDFYPIMKGGFIVPEGVTR